MKKRFSGTAKEKHLFPQRITALQRLIYSLKLLFPQCIVTSPSGRSRSQCKKRRMQTRERTKRISSSRCFFPLEYKRRAAAASLTVISLARKGESHLRRRRRWLARASNQRFPGAELQILARPHKKRSVTGLTEWKAKICSCLTLGRIFGDRPRFFLCFFGSRRKNSR